MLLALLAFVVVVSPGPTARSPASASSSFPAGYHTADQISSLLQQIASQYPTIASSQSIGPTWETTQGLASRQMMALRICSGCAAGPRPAIVFFGGQEADEISTSEVLLDFAQDLVSRWPTDPDVDFLLQSTTIWIVPLTNPDGHAKVEAGFSTWGKNTDSSHNQPGDASLTLPNGIGVDLNRNFGYQWGQGGASATPGDYNYQGPSAFSEPEEQAMRDFLTAVHPAVTIDVHNPLALVLWPWGYQSPPAPDAALLSAAGTRLAQLAGYASNQTYFAVGYTTGDALDWSYGTFGTLGLGLELDQGYAPDIGTVQSIWQKNRTGLYDAVRWAMNPVRAQGPGVNAANLSQSGGSVSLQVTFSTTHAGGSAVAEARYSIDQPDPTTSSQTLTLSPASTGFATGTPSFLPALGVHRIYVAAKDAAGQWGPVTALEYGNLPNAAYFPLVP